MKSDDALKKHTLNLYEGDYKRIGDHYPDVGAGTVIRKLVRTHLDKLEPPIDLKTIKETLDD